MVEILLSEYWSKSTAFLLPLTGMTKTEDFDVRSFVKWNNYNIERYQLVIKAEYGHKFSDFQEYLQKHIGKVFITEVFDYEGFSILIADISEWASDIEHFMKGKYSMLSNEAKSIIKKYHIFYKNRQPNMNISMYICLYPEEKQGILDNKSPIEYVADYYGLPYDKLSRLGEICSKCDIEKETLVLEPCQVDIPVKLD